MEEGFELFIKQNTPSRIKSIWNAKRRNQMYDELTQKDIQKMEEEIEYRKLVVRKEADRESVV